MSLSWDYLCLHAVRGHNLLLSEFQLSRNSHSISLVLHVSHFFHISVFTLSPVPLATRVLIPGSVPVALILFPAPLLLCLLLSFLSTLRLAVSISVLPGHPAETCNLNSKAASLRLCPEKVFLSKHYSKSYEYMKRFHAAQVKLRILKITSETWLIHSLGDYCSSGEISSKRPIIRNNEERGHRAMISICFVKIRVICTEDQREAFLGYHMSHHIENIKDLPRICAY